MVPFAELEMAREEQVWGSQALFRAMGVEEAARHGTGSDNIGSSMPLKPESRECASWPCYRGNHLFLPHIQDHLLWVGPSQPLPTGRPPKDPVWKLTPISGEELGPSKGEWLAQDRTAG